ncbi:NUDIX domain-containing protein [Sphingomonas oligophenolica]|uniref:NUDIX domain-containing protein n=1 Tax=Sphingomonas oligophenolica TaxID=301154 RepID=UPI0031E03968
MQSMPVANSKRGSRRLSAGILAYRHHEGTVEVFLVHPGGPFWAARDQGAWQIPKGMVEPDEDPSDAARREFREEIGNEPSGVLQPLGRIRQAGGKWVEAFTLAAEIDPDAIVSNRFDLEWPPRSGIVRSFPEIDRAGWFPIGVARAAMLASQLPLLDRLETLLGAR